MLKNVLVSTLKLRNADVDPRWAAAISVKSMQICISRDSDFNLTASNPWINIFFFVNDFLFFAAVTLTPILTASTAQLKVPWNWSTLWTVQRRVRRKPNTSRDTLSCSNWSNWTSGTLLSVDYVEDDDDDDDEEDYMKPDNEYSPTSTGKATLSLKLTINWPLQVLPVILEFFRCHKGFQ